jgi:hypothetical protein
MVFYGDPYELYFCLPKPNLFKRDHDADHTLNLHIRQLFASTSNAKSHGFGTCSTIKLVDDARHDHDLKLWGSIMRIINRLCLSPCSVLSKVRTPKFTAA